MVGERVESMPPDSPPKLPRRKPKGWRPRHQRSWHRGRLPIARAYAATFAGTAREYGI